MSSDVLTDVMRNLLCDSSLQRLREFMDEHEGKFEEGKEEHSLEHTDIHRRYASLVESMVENVLAKQGVSVEAFYDICKAAQGEGDPAAMIFVELFVATTEFRLFADTIRSRQKRDYLFHILDGWQKMQPAK